MTRFNIFTKIKNSFRDVNFSKIFHVLIPVTFVLFMTYTIFYSNDEKFSLVTSQYTYSAVFQGFAAILAITITVALVSLQSIGTQINTFEERVFRMIKESVPTYRITSMKDADVYIKTKFENEFRKELEKTPQERSISNIVIEITDEIKRLFKFIGIVETNEESIRRYFIYALLVSIIVLVLNLFALVYTADENEPSVYYEFADFKFNQYTILYSIFYVTIYGIFSTSYFFYQVLKAWTTKYDPSRY